MAAQKREVVKLEHTGEEDRIVSAQLGRPTRGRWAVATRCHLGLPTVIENHPRLEDGEPFPTLFWLTCPVLVKRVSRQEAEGRMKAISDSLTAEAGLTQRLAAALERYAAHRAEHEVIEVTGAPPGGGPDRVKCLHAHTAHELAGGNNPIGALALAEAGFPECVTPCVTEASGGRS